MHDGRHATSTGTAVALALLTAAALIVVGASPATAQQATNETGETGGFDFDFGDGLGFAFGDSDGFDFSFGDGPGFVFGDDNDSDSGFDFSFADGTGPGFAFGDDNDTGPGFDFGDDDERGPGFGFGNGDGFDFNFSVGDGPGFDFGDGDGFPGFDFGDDDQGGDDDGSGDTDVPPVNETVYDLADVETQPAADATVAPDLRTEYEGARTNESVDRVTVIVSLVELPDSKFDVPPNATEEERRNAVISSLQAHADRTQAPLKRMVGLLEGATVQNSFWIANDVVVSANPNQVPLEQFRRVKNVTRLSPNTQATIPDPPDNGTVYPVEG